MRSRSLRIAAEKGRGIVKTGLVLCLAMTFLLAGCTAQYAAAGPGELQHVVSDAAQNTGPDAVKTAGPVRVCALKGPTAMGMAPMMTEAEGSEAPDFSFEIVSAVDEIPVMIARDRADIAAMPANLAAVLYQKLGQDMEVLAVNTLGVLYIVENRQDEDQAASAVSSIADLRGRTLYASGKGATPEYALSYILRENGLDPDADVRIEWKSEHAECLAALLADPDGCAMLPQPFVTTACMKSENVVPVLDLNEEWDRIQENTETPASLITGVVAARRSFAESHREEIAAFLRAYGDSIGEVNADPAAAAAQIGALDIVPEAVARAAIPACHIVYLDGEEMKAALSGYLEVLYEAEPASVGGALPGEDFYGAF